MILQKRISKPPKQFFTPANLTSKYRKKKQNVAKIEGERSNYQLIPPLLKYSYNSNIYVLYGDILLMRQNDMFVTELSLLNVRKRYLTISTSHISDQKVINILLEHINVGSLDNWMSLKIELEKSDDPKYLDLSKTVQNYCQTFELSLEKQMEEKEKESRVKKTIKKRISKLFKEHPCIWLKHRFRGEEFQIVEILLAESYIKLMGYSIESFASTTLKEGIPRIEKNSTLDAKSLLNSMINQFNFQQKKCSKPVEFTSFLILKCGYIRKVICQIHHMLTFEGDLFGMESVIAVISAETPQIDSGGLFDYKIEEKFLEAAITEDEEKSNFFEIYYGTNKFQRYKQIEKVCKIREIILKKEE